MEIKLDLLNSLDSIDETLPADVSSENSKLECSDSEELADEVPDDHNSKDRLELSEDADSVVS